MIDLSGSLALRRLLWLLPFEVGLRNWRGSSIPFAMLYAHFAGWLFARSLGDVLQHAGTKPRGFGGLIVDG